MAKWLMIMKTAKILFWTLNYFISSIDKWKEAKARAEEKVNNAN